MEAQFRNIPEALWEQVSPLIPVPKAAKKAMDFILDVYRIERAALDAGILGCPSRKYPRVLMTLGDASGRVEK